MHVGRLALELAGTSLLPAVTRMTGSAAALVSFVQASGLLYELAGAQVITKCVERSAEALGREIAALERRQPRHRSRANGLRPPRGPQGPRRRFPSRRDK